MGQSSPAFHNPLFPWYCPYSLHTCCPASLLWYSSREDYSIQQHPLTWSRVLSPQKCILTLPTLQARTRLKGVLISTEQKGGMNPRIKALLLLPQLKYPFIQLNVSSALRVRQCFLCRKAVYSYCQDTNLNATYQSKSIRQIQATSKQELNAGPHDWCTSLPSREHCPFEDMLLEALALAKS